MLSIRQKRFFIALAFGLAALAAFCGIQAQTASADTREQMAPPHIIVDLYRSVPNRDEMGGQGYHATTYQVRTGDSVEEHIFVKNLEPTWVPEIWLQGKFPFNQVQNLGWQAVGANQRTGWGGMINTAQNQYLLHYAPEGGIEPDGVGEYIFTYRLGEPKSLDGTILAWLTHEVQQVISEDNRQVIGDDSSRSVWLPAETGVKLFRDFWKDRFLLYRQTPSGQPITALVHASMHGPWDHVTSIFRIPRSTFGLDRFGQVDKPCEASSIVSELATGYVSLSTPTCQTSLGRYPNLGSGQFGAKMPEVVAGTTIPQGMLADWTLEQSTSYSLWHLQFNMRRWIGTNRYPASVPSYDTSLMVTPDHALEFTVEQADGTQKVQTFWRDTNGWRYIEGRAELGKPFTALAQVVKLHLTKEGSLYYDDAMPIT